jgi:hypothetical protein
MLNSHEEIIHKNILPRLDVLEEAQNAFRQEVTLLKSDLMGVQRGQAQLEVTVMKDGKETRALLKQFVTHVLGQDEKETQAEIDRGKQKWEIIGKVAVALVGSGGLLYLVVEAFTK